jgi:hypothetical protein
MVWHGVLNFAVQGLGVKPGPYIQRTKMQCFQRGLMICQNGLIYDIMTTTYKAYMAQSRREERVVNNAVTCG